jgi:hypothetical protein
MMADQIVIQDQQPAVILGGSAASARSSTMM